VYTPFHEKSDDAGTIAWQALANAGIMLAVIAVMTGESLILLTLQPRDLYLIRNRIFPPEQIMFQFQTFLDNSHIFFGYMQDKKV
jgi:hypothetical protein